MSFVDPGRTVALRWVFRDRLWGARAATVVADGPERTLLAWGPGSEWWSAHGTGRHSAERRWELALAGTWDLVERPWTGSRVLFALEPDRPYGIGLFWDADSGAFRNYYVNFQLPYRRSHAGFDSLDLDLDLVVSPDLSWRWKDEDDWAVARTCGALAAETIASVEASRVEVLARVAAGLGDLRGWVGWTPDPAWKPARLRAGWDRLGDPAASAP